MIVVITALQNNYLFSRPYLESVRSSNQVDLQVLLVQGGLQHILKGAHASGQVIAKLLSLELLPGLA